MQLIPIGYGNAVSASRLVAVVSPESAPIKRIIQDARDATYGRKTKSVLVMDSDHVILSASSPASISGRAEDTEEDEEEE